MAFYLILGDDEERKARGVEKLRRGRATDAYDAAAGASPEEVISACNSYSLFGDGAFVVVRNLDAWNAAQKAKIVGYLKDPSPEADLVLLGKKLGSREKLLAAAKKAGEVHDFEQPTGKALERWISGYAKKQSLELPEEVAAELNSRCSGDKARLSREVEKLALYAEEGRATLQDVEALCPPDIQSNIFAFVDSLATGNRARALKLLEDLLGTGEPPMRLAYMIRRQFQLLTRARALYDRNAPQREVASALKVPPFVARKLDEQSRKLSGDDLEEALDVILDLERGLKGGLNLGDELQLELAVMKLSG